MLKPRTILIATVLDGCFSQVKKVVKGVFQFLTRYYEKRVPFSQILKYRGYTDAVVQRCSKTKACKFIKKETLAQVFSGGFFEISQNNFFHRTFLVAASGHKMIPS